MKKQIVKIVVALVVALFVNSSVAAAVDNIAAANMLDKWSSLEKNPEKSEALKTGAKALRGQAITDSERGLALRQLGEFKMNNPADQEYVQMVQTALEGGVTSTDSAPPVSQTVLSTASPVSASQAEINASKAILQSKIGSKDFRSHNNALKSATDTNALGVAMEEGLVVLNGGTTKEDKALLVHILTETAKKAELDLGSMSRLHPDYAECHAVGKAFRVAAAMIAGSGLTISSSTVTTVPVSNPAPATTVVVIETKAPVAPKSPVVQKKITRPAPVAGHQAKAVK